MKLAVFTSKYPARVATFFERDMRALLEAGVDIEVFPIYPLDASQWKYSLELLNEDHLPRERVHHLSFGGALKSGLRQAQRRGTAMRDAATVLASAARFGPVTLAKTGYVLPKAWAWAQHGRRFDHVLAYWGNYAGTCAYAYHRIVGRDVPFSIWLHAGTDLYRTPVFLRRKLLYADNVITCCEFNKEFIGRQFADVRAAILPKTHVVHHGLDLAQFPYRPDGRRTNKVIAVGRLSKYKGFDFLLRATRVLAGRGVDISVELVGDGDQRSALQRLAADLGIVDRVWFRGWLSFTDVRRAMSDATLLAHPSEGLGDGLPNVVREAMALGTPVVASRVAGIPDALRDECGTLVPPRDPEALADAMQRLLVDPGARRRFARNARRRVEERYDLWRNGTVLARLLKGSRRRAVRSTPSRTWPVTPTPQETAAC